jgi:hypothetical protein
MLASSLSISVTTAEDETATLPTRTLGDKWTVSVNYQFPSGMTGTMTNEVTSTSASVSSYDCTELTLTGGGTLSGQGSWTINGKLYETKTDYGTARSENTIESKTPTFNETITTMTDYNPPLNNNGFPLFVGKSWTAPTTQTNMGVHVLNGALTQSNESKTTTYTFSVLRTEDVTVPAGEFQTFVIKMTLIDGTPNNGTSSEIYYSAKAHNTVKELDYLPNGRLAFSLELLNYNVAETSSTTTAAPTLQPTNNPTTNPTQPSSTINTPSSTGKASSSPSPTPLIPEYPSVVAIAVLLLIILQASLAVAIKRRRC